MLCLCCAGRIQDTLLLSRSVAAAGLLNFFEISFSCVNLVQRASMRCGQLSGRWARLARLWVCSVAWDAADGRAAANWRRGACFLVDRWAAGVVKSTVLRCPSASESLETRGSPKYPSRIKLHIQWRLGGRVWGRCWRDKRARMGVWRSFVGETSGCGVLPVCTMLDYPVCVPLSSFCSPEMEPPSLSPISV